MRLTGTISIGATADGGVEAGRLLHVELGHPPQLGEAEADGGIDVGLGLALGGVAVGELAGRLPLDRALALQHARQITQERDAPERVVSGSGSTERSRLYAAARAVRCAPPS